MRMDPDNSCVLIAASKIQLLNKVKNLEDCSLIIRMLSRDVERRDESKNWIRDRKPRLAGKESRGLNKAFTVFGIGDRLLPPRGQILASISITSRILPSFL